MPSKLSCAVLSIFCIVALVALKQSICLGQSVCASEVDEWRKAFAELQEAIGEAERLRDSSVAQAVKDAVARRPRGETMADAIRGVVEDKAARVAESQRKCWALAEQETMAYKKMNKCAATSGAKRDSSVNLRIREFTRERDKTMRDLKYVMTEEAYIQYLNQMPLTRDDYSYDRQSSSTAWYTGSKANR